MIAKIRILHACVAMFILSFVVLISFFPSFIAFIEKFKAIIALVPALFGIAYLIVIAKARKKGDFPKNIFEQFLYVNLGIKIPKGNKIEKLDEKTNNRSTHDP